jgi:hypothetical protein
MAIQFWEIIGRSCVDEAFRKKLLSEGKESLPPNVTEEVFNTTVNGIRPYRLSRQEVQNLFRLFKRQAVVKQFKRLGELWRDAKGPVEAPGPAHQLLGLICIDTDLRKELTEAGNAEGLKVRAEAHHFDLSNEESRTLYEMLYPRPDPTLQAFSGKAGSTKMIADNPFTQTGDSAQDCMIIIECAWSPPADLCDARLLPKKGKLGDVADVNQQVSDILADLGN